jgi:hypothetical protein
MHSGNINNLSYYYFPEALKILLFSEQIVVGQNCMKNSYQNSIQIHSNIHRIHVKGIASEKKSSS